MGGKGVGYWIMVIENNGGFSNWRHLVGRELEDAIMSVCGCSRYMAKKLKNYRLDGR